MRCLHCDTPIDEHPTSRCLRAWIAHDVMEWEVINGKDGLPAHIITNKGEHMYLQPDLGPQWYPDFDITAAWEVVEKMCEQWPDFSIAKGWEDNPDKWAVVWGYDGHGWDWQEADPAPLAICRAAIKSVNERR